MISEKFKFLFIHIPKTGGNSIQQALLPYTEDKIVNLSTNQDGKNQFEVRSGIYKTTKHSNLIRYKHELGAKKFRSLYKFCNIRNPWDRMISFYFSPHRGSVEWSPNKFKQLLHQQRQLRYYICTRTISERICTKLMVPTPNVFTKILGEEMDNIIRFENINEDFRIVCDELGLKYSPLEILNQSKREHYSIYYDNKLKDLVYKFFKEEIVFGNYSFDTR